MSTIGEALRKVQKQRMTGEPPPQVTPHFTHAPQHPSPGHSSHIPVFLAILIGVLLVSGTALYLFRGATFSIVVDGRSLPFTNKAESPQLSPTEPKPPIPVPAPSPAPVVKASVGPSGPEGSGQVSPTHAPPAASLESPRHDMEQVVKPSHRDAIARTDLPALGGIFYSERNPVAIINGSSMMEGEKTGRYTIVKIGVYSVMLKDENGEFEVRLQ